ncbi:MAG: cytidine deaminase [Pseudomonadota bacterium]
MADPLAAEQEAALTAAALAVRDRAYAPYSGFRVGAALLDEQGRIHAGCNVENVAYPQSQCAEASAIGVMVAAGGRQILAVAVAGPDGRAPTPCGGCRQRLAEFAGPETPVLICDATGIVGHHLLGALLPANFGPELHGG